VNSKYGSAWGGWCSNEAHGLHGMGLWKNIYIYIYIYIKSVKGPQVHMKHTREATKLGGAKRTRKL
jgi:hypothetical protein